MDEQPQHPRVAVIVPSWTGEVERLTESLERQTYHDYTIDVVRGVSPAARARNVGAARARADLLLFIDDDAFFGHERVLAQLVAVLDRDPGVAVVGTSKLAPTSASPLQQAIARQVPRTVYPVVPKDTESNPPLEQYGFTPITTTCCLVRRAAWEEASGFDEELTTGPEDTDFFYRLHHRGHRILLAGNTWVYHDPPEDLCDLLRKSFWYGLGHALEARKSPERQMAVLPLDRWYGKLILAAAPLAFLPSLFVHFYFEPVRRLEFGFRPLKTLSTYAVLGGYAYGWFSGKPSRPAATYRGRKGAGGERSAPSKILYIDPFPKFGGGQQVLQVLITKLTAERYEGIAALAPTSPLHSRLTLVGVRSVNISFDESNNSLPSFRSPKSVIHTLLGIGRVVRETIAIARSEHIALIHANSVVAGVQALPAAIWLQIPCVVHAHDFATAPLTNLFLKVFLRFYRKAGMVFVSQALANFYHAGNKGEYLYRVIHNGVDADLFRPDGGARARLLNDFGLPSDTYLIGSVGRIEPGKGFGLLLESFAIVVTKYPQARLVVVGDVLSEQFQGMRHELDAKVQQFGLDGTVLFTGFRDDIPAVMAAFDVLAFTPVEPEGFGLTLLEAMACSRPVVTIPIGGIPEVVFDGINGLLVPAGDPKVIAATLARLIEAPSLAQTLGETGRRLALESFNLTRQVRKLEQLYDVLLSQGLPAPAEQEGETGTDETGTDMEASSPISYRSL
jgi:glycosyltransferase involved in cell wall biosynthesis